MFLTPAAVGDLTLDVEALRAGRSIQQISTLLRNSAEDLPALALRSTWGRREPDPISGVGLTVPEVPDPDDPSVSPLVIDERFAHLQLHVNFEERACPGHVTQGALLDGMVAESAVWARLVDGHRDSGDQFDPAVLAVLADRVPGPHLGSTISPPGRDLPPRPMVTLELSIRFVTDPTSEWLLLRGTVVEAANRYVTTRATIWDLDRNLIAIADQTARFAATPVDPQGRASPT